MLLISLFVAVVLIALVATKTLLFRKSIKNKKLLYWFFFSKYNIIGTSSPESRKSKQLQNQLSAILFIMLVIELAVVFMVRKPL